MEPRQHEAVAAYSRKQALEITRTAHEAAVKLLAEAGACLQLGMTEAEARQAIEAIFACHGIRKSWHRPYIYFGAHTVINAYDPKPKAIRTLAETDIAYIDLGPVVRIEGVDVEGDIGQTFVFGGSPLFEQLKNASESIFEHARTFWLEKQPTGIELYHHIHRLTEEMGLVFNLRPAGHLIGTFPHQGWKHGLNTYPHCPEPGLWILEIQVRHPVQPYGAFYEAVLLPE